MSGDTTEFRILAAELGHGATLAPGAVRKGMGAVGEMVARQWHDNAVQTSGTHAKLYPSSLGFDLGVSPGGALVDVGPSATDYNQGFLGRVLEFGGRRSPAHLDGLKALDSTQPKVEATLTALLNPLVP